jgi:multiple sugar transport system permease protein
MVNSLIVATGGTILGVLTATSAGYAFGKKQFPGREWIFWIILATMMIPQAATLVPLFFIMRDLGLVNTHLGMFVIYLSWPFGIFFMRQYVQSIPDDLIDAAKLDGAGEIGIFRWVILPLSKPVIGVLVVLAFIGGWGNYLWQLVIAGDTDKYTILVGVASLAQGYQTTDWGLVFAGATLAFVPMAFVFVRFQSYFTRGIMLGALNE